MTKKISFILICYYLSLLNVNSQVTIGSDGIPAKGALLQLKEDNSLGPNSTKGLLLPRVVLTNIESLTDIEGADTGNPLSYIGMIIYNPVQSIDNCFIPIGLYIWNGVKWRSIGNEKLKENASTNILKEDLEALKSMINDPDNINNTSGWGNFDTSGNTEPILNGVQYGTICGSRRVTSLVIADKNFKSLDLTKLTALTSLNCNSNNATYLNINGLSSLENITCDNNDLNTLDVSTNKRLTTLHCRNNNLATLDVSKNTSLKFLHCNSNDLNTLDISKNIDLLQLDCNSNNLTTLDLSKNINLMYLNFMSNNLTTLDINSNIKLMLVNSSNNPNLNTLDVSKNINLTHLYCTSNNLATIDISKNTNLMYLHCNSNNLTTLDLSKNISLAELDCSSNNLGELSVTIPVNVYDNATLNPDNESNIYNIN